MDCSAWQAVCLVLAIAVGVLAFKVAVLLKSLDKLIEQLAAPGEGAHREVGVYSRNRRIVALALLVNEEGERDRLALEAKDGELDRLNEQLAFFSHDIRTPVAVIQGYMELLEVDGQEANRQGYLEKIREKLAAMRAMIDELCDYSVIAATDVPPSCADVVVYDVLCSVLADYYEAFVARGWEHRIEFDDESYRLICPEGDLRRVLSNLVGNVLEYGAAEPHVTLTDNVLRISNEVDDSRALDTARMFERFWRADPSRPAGGNGLGLAVARALCERMGIGISAATRHDVLEIALVLPAKRERSSLMEGRA